MLGGGFDAIVSDITMPGYSAIGFVRGLRERQIDVPVILMTGNPSVETSIRAVEYGVFRYLLKPVGRDLLVETVASAVRLNKETQVKRRALEVAAVEAESVAERASVGATFDRALQRLWVAFQPIVSWRQRQVFAHEALVRSDEPAMANPHELLTAAERLGRLGELGRLVRAKAAEAAAALPGEVRMFVNLHSSDLDDPDLFDPDSPLARIASRVVLEVTERASLDLIDDVPARLRSLRALGFQIAIDDLGAGYAGLTSFIVLEPTFVKIDMSLVRGIDAHPRKQSIVRSILALCAGLGMTVVAEGVETPAERAALEDLGCDLLQGYLFARPARGFATPDW